MLCVRTGGIKECGRGYMRIAERGARERVLLAMWKAGRVVERGLLVAAYRVLAVLALATPPVSAGPV